MNRKSVYVIALIACSMCSSGFAQPRVIDLLGVHSIFWDTQRDLADTSGKIKPEIIEKLREAGVSQIRYGGGVNEIDWADCTGQPNTRRKLKLAPWMKPAACLYGYQENELLLSQITAERSWYVLNISGFFYSGSLSSNLRSNENFVSHLKSLRNGRIVYLELGNELDRPPHQFNTQQISRAYSIQVNALKADRSFLKPVLPLVEFDSPSVGSARLHNAEIIRSSRDSGTDFSLHTYYGGAPEGPSIANRNRFISTLCKQILESSPQSKLWVTEHARWPTGNTQIDDWESNWYLTGNAEGAMFTASFVLSMMTQPCIAGAFYHGLRAGPWNFLDLKEGVAQHTRVSKLFGLLSVIDNYRAITQLTRTDENYINSSLILADTDSGSRAMAVLNRSSITTPHTTGKLTKGQRYRVRTLHFESSRIVETALDASGIFNAPASSLSVIF